MYHADSPGVAGRVVIANLNIVIGVLLVVEEDMKGRVHRRICDIGTLDSLRIRCVPRGVVASSVSFVVYRLTKGILFVSCIVANISDNMYGVTRDVSSCTTGNLSDE
jgi:hypothetical protein